jgi:hypothetical protein
MQDATVTPIPQRPNAVPMCKTLQEVESHPLRLKLASHERQNPGGSMRHTSARHLSIGLLAVTALPAPTPVEPAEPPGAQCPPALRRLLEQTQPSQTGARQAATVQPGAGTETVEVRREVLRRCVNDLISREQVHAEGLPRAGAS